MPALKTVTALRYVQPLREGGSLPAVVDTDGGTFVVKFRGAGQGAKALVAEIIMGLLASELELPSPELAVVNVSPIFGRSEPDPEIQDLLRASHGLNIGLRYLDGAFNFALSAAGDLVTPEFASRLVWLDAFLTNPDRTARNPNLLVWQRTPWLIDHGSALYIHHDWDRADEARIRSSFPLIRDHVLLPLASEIRQADVELAGRLDERVIRSVVDQVPGELLTEGGEEGGEAAARARERYVDYLRKRVAEPRGFVAEAIAAREAVLAAPHRPRPVRR